jgi:hypothetical protein
MPGRQRTWEESCPPHQPAEVVAMWALMVTTRMEPGRAQDLPVLVARMRAAGMTMGEIFDGAPASTDLTVVDDWS